MVVGRLPLHEALQAAVFRQQPVHGLLVLQRMQGAGDVGQLGAGLQTRGQRLEDGPLQLGVPGKGRPGAAAQVGTCLLYTSRCV